MRPVGFRVTSAWPMMRLLEYSQGNCPWLDEAEMERLKSFSLKCRILQTRKAVQISDTIIEELDVAIKLLGLMSRHAIQLVGEKHAATCGANARSTRLKLVEIRARLDLTGSPDE